MYSSLAALIDGCLGRRCSCVLLCTYYICDETRCANVVGAEKGRIVVGYAFMLLAGCVCVFVYTDIGITALVYNNNIIRVWPYYISRGNVPSRDVPCPRPRTTAPLASRVLIHEYLRRTTRVVVCCAATLNTSSIRTIPSSS